MFLYENQEPRSCLIFFSNSIHNSFYFNPTFPAPFDTMASSIKANLSLLSKLRKESFAPLLKVRAALIQTNNDYNASLALLNSQPASVKLAARSTPQGLISLVRGIRKP
jgi:hypothetical protein